VVVRSAAKLEWIKDILSNPKVVELAEKMIKVNPQTKKSTLEPIHTHLKFKNISEDIGTKY
jgi:predicted metal-dependent phosphotriesterase family hydrolase